MSWNFTNVNGPYGGTSEGPAWDGSGLLFTVIPYSYIMRYDPEVARCDHLQGRARTTRTGLCSTHPVRCSRARAAAGEWCDTRRTAAQPCLADGFEGKKLNVPNDLAIDHAGRVWFTDPLYEGAGGAWSEDRSNKELDHDSVYRLDPQADGSWSITRVTFDTTRPNGLLFSLAYNTLYVAQSGRLPEEKRELARLPRQQ